MRWPSGLRRQLKVLPSGTSYNRWSERAWVQIPLSSTYLLLFGWAVRTTPEFAGEAGRFVLLLFSLRVGGWRGGCRGGLGAYMYLEKAGVWLIGTIGGVWFLPNDRPDEGK